MMRSVERTVYAPNWSDSNVPWAYASVAEFNQGWPSDVVYADIQATGNDFYTNLLNTVNASTGRVVVRLGVGVYHLNQFRMIGSSGSPTYAFGFWFPKLQGIIGQGADKTTIQMDANSMSSAQLDDLATMTQASFAPNQMGLCRLDGSVSSPVLLGGLTFQAADQQMLTTASADNNIVVPQPAPHCGVVLYSGSSAIISHVRFQGAARAATSQPPFEHANISSQYTESLLYRNCEFDGHRSPILDPAKPRRCGPIMLNNELDATMQDCWIHHSNVSRYAANDQNRNTSGQYRLIRVQAEQITNNQNIDPALNNGISLRGYTNASLFGWESCSGTITITDCNMSQDNPYTDAGIAQHLSLTSVGTRNPQGGRLVVNGGVYHNPAWPQLEGFLCVRAISNTYWVMDGYNTTIRITSSNGVRLTPYVVSGWPPSAASLAAAGISPATHFIVRNT